jgi:hypothetical protein
MNTVESTQTESISKPEKDNSKIFGVSLRGIITLIVVLTVCVMSIGQLEVREPLYTLAGMVIGYYFAQSQSNKQNK